MTERTVKYIIQREPFITSVNNRAIVSQEADTESP